METWQNKCREGDRRRGPGVREMKRERRMEEELEGELEGELRSMQQAQEFMIRKGDESVIYGPLYRFSALLSVMRNGCCGWRVRARLSSSPLATTHH